MPRNWAHLQGRQMMSLIPLTRPATIKDGVDWFITVHQVSHRLLAGCGALVDRITAGRSALDTLGH